MRRSLVRGDNSMKQRWNERSRFSIKAYPEIAPGTES